MKFKILVLKIAFSSEIFKKLEIDFASQHFNIQYLIFPVGINWFCKPADVNLEGDNKTGHNVHSPLSITTVFGA